MFRLTRNYFASFFTFIGIFFATLALNNSEVQAETYLGLFAGYQFDTRPTNMTATEDLNYSSGYSPTNTPATASDIDLKRSLTGGAKLGYFLDQQPNIGIEFSSRYSRPDYKRQNVTINIPPGVVSGLTSFTEDQLPSDFHMITSNVSFLYRFIPQEKFRPYLGVGPTLYVLFIRGSGRSGKLVEPWVSPDWNQGTVGDGFGYGFGIAGKLGVEYRINKQWSIDLEYQASKGTIKVNQFRSFTDIKVDMADQIVTTGLRYSF